VTEADEKQERIKRVRIGLTGLAVVLLLALLATALLTGIGGQTGNNVSAKGKPGDEPLSDLGMAPRAPDNGVATGLERPKP
jgi:hypothetical protein